MDRLVFSGENRERLRGPNKVILYWVGLGFAFGYAGGALMVAIYAALARETIDPALLLVGFFIAAAYFVFAGLLFGVLAFLWFQFGLNVRYVDDNWLCLGGFCLFCAAVSTRLFLLALDVYDLSTQDSLFWLAFASSLAGTLAPRVLIPGMRPSRVKAGLLAGNSGI